MTKHRGLISLALMAVAVLFIAFTAGNCRAEEEAATAGKATVTSDTLPVYPEMYETGEAVRTLHKGDSVTVEFELQRVGEAWCAISGEAGELMGYVNCDGLEQGRRELWTPAGVVDAGSVSYIPTTDITVIGNHAIVPVTLAYKGKETSAKMLLDTGASGTAVNAGIASSLGLELDKAAKVHALAMGGNTVDIRLVQLDSMTVGPHRKDAPTIGVYEKVAAPEDFDGVLGMDFLSTVEYNVDLKAKVIRWGK